MKNFTDRSIIIFLISVLLSNICIAQHVETSLKKIKQDRSNVLISWTKTETFKGKYKVYRSTDSKIFLRVGEVSKNDTNYVDKTIKESGLYYYQIMAELPDTFFVSNIQEINVDITQNIKDKNLKSGSINDVEKLETNISEQYQLNVFPTVFKSELNITLDGEIKNLKLFDMSGRELYTENVEDKKGIHTIQLGHLSKGTYILSADNEPFKVIKE